MSILTLFAFGGLLFFFLNDANLDSQHNFEKCKYRGYLLGFRFCAFILALCPLISWRDAPQDHDHRVGHDLGTQAYNLHLAAQLVERGGFPLPGHGEKAGPKFWWFNFFQVFPLQGVLMTII